MLRPSKGVPVPTVITTALEELIENGRLIGTQLKRGMHCNVIFITILFVVNGTDVMGIIGREIELSCCYPERKLPKEFRVTWQIEGETNCLVDAHVDKTMQCARFVNRTRLSDQLMQGNFTLQIFNISPNDEHTYTCHILERKGRKFEHVNSTSANLKVAGKHLSLSLCLSLQTTN